MPFTNSWDTTFPPDTQLANLLGQDIRNGVKVDVQQRMAAISGLDAAKPRFDLDAQPANWNGILFFATDTAQIYQFANPGWTNVTSSIIGNTKTAFRNNVQVTNTGNVTNNNIYTPTLVGGSMGVNGVVRVTAIISIGGTTNANVTITLLLGATLIATFVITGSVNGHYCRFTAYIKNQGATNSQETSFDAFNIDAVGQNLNGVGFGFNAPSAIDTTVNQLITMKCQNANAATTATFNGFLFEIL